MTANALRIVSLSVAGAAAAPCRPVPLTVADLLADQNITLAATDTVDPGAHHAGHRWPADHRHPGRGHHGHRDGRRAATDQQIDDPALDKGTTVVAVAGTARASSRSSPR